MQKRAFPLLLALAVVLLTVAYACQGGAPSPRAAATPAPAASAGRAGKGDSVPTSVPRIVVLGDSLTAGLGLPADEAYPALLQRRLNEAGYRAEVVNAGVSGDTTAGGLRRLDWALDGDVRILVVALGANDGLRGLPVPDMKHNLAAIIERARRRGIDVLLAGMEALPNFGAGYTVAFRRAFGDLAAEYHVAFAPFLLQDVAGISTLNQSDEIHPNAAGAKIIAEHLWPVLEPLVEKRIPRGHGDGRTGEQRGHRGRG